MQLYNGRGCFDSQYEGTVHCGDKGTPGGTWGSCSLVSTVKKQKEMSMAHFHGQLFILD